MPDRRRPGAGPVERRDGPASIVAALIAGKPPLDNAAIAEATGMTRAAAARLLKDMRQRGLVRWIKRTMGGPGYALPRTGEGNAL